MFYDSGDVGTEEISTIAGGAGTEGISALARGDDDGINETVIGSRGESRKTDGGGDDKIYVGNTHTVTLSLSQLNRVTLLGSLI